MIVIGVDQVIKGDGAVGRIIDIRRKRARSIGRAEGTGYKAFAMRVGPLKLVSRLNCDSCRRNIELICKFLQTIVCK